MTQTLTTQPHELYPHQREGVAFLLAHPRAVLADDVGLGKTVQAASYIAALNTRSIHPARPAVAWVTDATLIPQTVAELNRDLPGFRITSSNNPAFKTNATKATRAALAALSDGVDVMVTSYQWVNSRAGSDVANWHPRLVVLDEGMAVKGNAATWSAVKSLTARAERCAGLTATPLENEPTETYALLDAVGTPGLWGRDDFERRFVEWQEPYEYDPGKWTDRKALGLLPGMAQPFAEYVRQHMLRRTATEVGLPLPQIEREVRTVPLGAAQQQAYDRAANLSGLWGHYKRQQATWLVSGTSALVDECVRLLRGPYAGLKVVVYAESLAVLGVLSDALTAGGIDHERLEGNVSAKDRGPRVESFRANDGPPVLVGSRVLERGLNLQNAATLLSLDSSYNPARERQREGRIRRIGSPHARVRHVTLLPDTPDAKKKMMTLQRKMGTARAIM